MEDPSPYKDIFQLCIHYAKSVNIFTSWYYRMIAFGLMFQFKVVVVIDDQHTLCNVIM